MPNAILNKIAADIASCRTCRRGCTGKAVPGEGSADARIVFIGEAPGREEAKTGRPFVGRSGKLLREMITAIGLREEEVFITSPVHYLPLRGTPSKDMILHGRDHLFRQLEIIRPEIAVLLGATACMAVLDRKVEVSKLHGTVEQKDGMTCFIGLHPAYAIRFQKARELFTSDFRKLKGLLRRMGIARR